MKVKKINTVFGVLEVKLGQVDSGDVDVKSFGLRETGLAKDILKIEARKRALDDPAKYLSDDEKDLETVGGDSGKEYIRAFNIALAKGLNEKDSEIYARQAMNSRKKMLMDDHNNKFPPELINMAWEKIKRKN